ncbi:MAG TPA: DUF4383 domain-containing protein [Phycisphaerales bacterium]|nr:DUF4383 domain-containing protein [Phycisphaerales bacterium]
MACGFPSQRASRIFSLTSGSVYGLAAIRGFAGWTPIARLLHLNPADNWLHTMIAAVSLVTGIVTMPRHVPPSTGRPA